MTGERYFPGAQARAGRGRHAAPAPVRPLGPVTLAFRAAAFEPRRRLSRLVLRAWPAVPALCLLWPARHGLLPAYADRVLGLDAVLALVACLAVTPVITVSRAPVTRLRWWYGNWVFALGCAGLAVHLAYPPGDMSYRMASDSVNWTGTVIVVLLLPMAVTSSTVAQRLLGQEWKRWQRVLVWVVWGCVGVHLALLHAWLVTGAYLAATLPVAVVRYPRARKGIREWRAGGYSTGGWWAATAVLGLVALTGLSALTGEEALAVARAIALAPP
jgi:DMSO/TMAO reductase YedYZ heme-binding membrane subunit